MGRRNYFDSFGETSSWEHEQFMARQIKSEIDSKGKAYILGVDEFEFKSYLVNKYSLEPLQIDYSTEDVPEPIKVREEMNNSWGERVQMEVYKFTISYKFYGSPVLFRIIPSTRILKSHEIDVDELSSIVSFQLKIDRLEPNEFTRLKERHREKSFANLDNVNVFAANWNNTVASRIEQLFSTQKNLFLKENDFFAAINVKVNDNTRSVFSAPTVKKRIIPQPTVPKDKVFTTEPTMSKEMYDDLLRVIYDSGKNMELKPSLYKAKDEEGLRDQFLFVMETRYEGTNASGETFNRGGKTDIILKYSADGSNLFVAECKFWHGAAEFHKAISQLFGRYLSWRDSKVALIIFVTNKEFTSVLNTITNEISKHPYFVKESGKRGESSFSFLFHLPQDSEKLVYFEVMAFHYDK